MYEPSARVAEILNWAMEELKGIPYEASTRWAFYQVAQHHGLKKTAYRTFLKWTSRARKNDWGGWTPTTLIDDTRAIDARGGGFSDPSDWFDSFRNRNCVLEVASRQDVVLLVLYEAEAMSRQFEYYLAPLRVSSAPFKGDASIRHKADIAAMLADAHEDDGEKPVVVLYFGDWDPKGLEIPRSALKDIWRWFVRRGDEVPPLEQLGDATGAAGREEWRTPDESFRWIRVGITGEHVARWHMPDNPERPGTYQWEALDDQAASELILGAVREFWDEGVVGEVAQEEQDATGRFREAIESALQALEDSED